MDPNIVLIKPVVSEKSLLMQEGGRYSFVVNPKANKNQIKNAVENLFAVTVVNVWTKKKAAKSRRTGQKRLLKSYSDQKIAVVQLKKGEQIQELKLKEK